MSIRDDVKKKYGVSTAAPSKTGTAAPVNTARQQVLDKYNSQPQIKVISQPTVDPASTIVPNLPQDATITPSPTNPPASNVITQPLSFFDKLKKAVGFDVQPKTSMVFNVDPAVKESVVNKAALQNYNDLQLKRAISSDTTVKEAQLMGNTPYEYGRLGDRFLASVANTIIPKSLQKYAAAPGSVADQSLSGVLDPENLAEQVASYSGTSLGTALLFSVAQPMVVSQLGKVPGFVSFAQNYPRTANIIAGALSFAGAGAISDTIQEKGVGQTLKDIPGNLLTGGGFGVGGPLKAVIPTVFSTSFLGSKLQGSSNTEALTSAVVNSLFAGGQTYMEAGNTGKLRDVAQENAFKTLNLKPTATQEEIKVAYRKLAHDTHPDKGGDPAKFVEVQAAYQIAKSSPAERDGIIAEWTKLYQEIKSGKNPFAVAKQLPASSGAQPAVPAQQVNQTSIIPDQPAGIPIPPGQAAAAAAPKTVAELSNALLSKQEVNTLMDTELNSKTVERLRNLNPEDQITFGRQIESTVKQVFEPGAGGDAVGKLTGYEFTTKPLASGAPAEFNPDGSITVSLPQLAADIQVLASGGRIAAHTNSPFATVFAKKEGETVNQLTARYVSDVILHEAGHVRTVSQADFKKGQEIKGRVDAAAASGNQASITAAKTEMDKHLQYLEDKANKYVTENKEALTKELFPQLKYVLQKYKGQAAEVKSYKSKFIRIFKNKFHRAVMESKVVKERSEAVAKAKEKIQSRQASIEDIRQEIYEYAKLLPANVRGKFLGAIKNTNTRKEFSEVLDRMKKVSQTSQRAGLMREIVKEIKYTKPSTSNKILKGKFTAEVQARLDGIRKNLNSSYEIARAKRNDIIAEWREQNGDVPLPDRILRQLEDLGMQGIKDMDAKELRFTLDAIRSLKETGRTANELIKFNRETRLTTIKEKIQEVITGGKPLPSDKQSLPERKPRSALGAAKDFFTIKQYGFEDIMDSLSEFDKGSKPYESFLSRFARKSHTANGVEFSGAQGEIEKGNKAIQKIYGVTKNREILNVLNDMNREIDLGRHQHTDGVVREIKMTRGEAMYFVALNENPALEQTFSEGMKWTPEIIDAVKKTLTEKDFQMVEWLMNDLQEYYPGINEVYRKENFVDLGFDDKYFPLYRQVEKLQKKEAAARSTSELLSGEVREYSTVKNSSLKTRTKNAVPIDPKNILDVWFDHKIKMEHYKAWAETMYDFRRVFGDPEVRQAITDFHGKPYLKVIDGFLDDMARGGIDQAKIVQGVERIRRNVTRSILGVNWKVSTRQLMGIVNYMVEVPVKDFFAGIGSFMTDPMGKANFLTAHSAILRERFGEGFERDIKFALKAGYDKQLSKVKGIDEYFFYLIRQADKMTVMPGSWAAYRSKYLELKGKGLSEEEARTQGIEFAELVTNRIQETSQLDTLSEIQRGGTLAKLATMFQSQPGKFWRIAINSIRNYRAGRGDKSYNLKRLFMVWFLLPMLWQFMVDGFKLNKKHLATTAALGPFSYPLILGQFIQQFAGWITGDNKYDFQPSAVLSAFSDAKNAGTNLATGDFVDGITYMIDFMGKASGIPTGLITKPIRKVKSDRDKGPKLLP